MKALFVTSATNDVVSLIRAWDCYQEEGSRRTSFPHRGKPRDGVILATALEYKPDIIFYIGANVGEGLPSEKTFFELQSMAPLVNLCCDGGDYPWHKTLARYQEIGCFDLQVTLDGHRDAPLDLVTVTPVDPGPFERELPRTIRCGFSGNFSPTTAMVFKSSFESRKAPEHTKPRRGGSLPAWRPLHSKRRTIPLEPQTERDAIIQDLTGVFAKPIVEEKTDRDNVIHDLSEDAVVTTRRRVSTTSYTEHAEFMMSCLMMLNTSTSGSGATHHIKGRVLEAGWAGCALLESEGSPIAEWFPEGSYFLYRDAAHARHLIQTLTSHEMSTSANLLSQHVRDHYHPRQIYGEVLSGLSRVDRARRIFGA